MILSSLLVFGFIFSLLYLYLARKSNRYPPGPSPWPIFGNWHQFGDEYYLDLIKLTKTFGDIFSIKLGICDVVVVNDFKNIKDSLGQIGISGRPQFPHLFDPDTQKPQGIIWQEGQKWEEQRRFVLKNLRDFGFGKKSMEVLVHEEINELIESLRREAGKPICTNNRFNMPVFNSLWLIIAGEKFSQSGGGIGQTLIHHMTEISKNASSFATLGYFEGWAKLMPESFGLNTYMSNWLPIYNFMKETVVSHKKTFQEGHNRDLLDCYLAQINNTSDVHSSFHKSVGEPNLHMVLYDLFFGGTETTSVTLSWTFLLLAHHPDIQENLYDEIKNIIGDSRLPSLSDRVNSPYTEATILEVMRSSTLVPILLRRAIMDTELAGFVIPKETLVFHNLYAVHQSKEIWGDPENFRPERFLSEEGKKLVKFLNPFGSGRRLCPGETLARDQLFLFVTSLFQNFRVTLDPNEINPKIDFTKGSILRMPTPHKIVVVDRHQQ